MIGWLRRLWGRPREKEELHPIPIEGPRERTYAFQYFARLKHEEQDSARVDGLRLFDRHALSHRPIGDKSP